MHYRTTDSQKFNYHGGNLYIFAEKTVAPNGIVSHDIYLGLDRYATTASVEAAFHMTVLQNEGGKTLFDRKIKVAEMARDILFKASNQIISAVDRPIPTMMVVISIF